MSNVREAPRIFRGWWIVGAGALIQTMIGGLIYQLYGAYVVVVQREFGWTTTALSAIYSLFRFESGLLGPPQGWLLDRYGPRPLMRAGMVLIGAGFLLLSQVQQLSTFLLAFAVIAVGSSFAGHISICVAIVNWFHVRKARAISITSMGYAVSGFIVPLVIISLEVWGWRATALGSGVAFLTVGLALTRPFHTRPEDCGCTVDGNPESPVVTASDTRAITAGEAIATPAF